MEMMNLKNRVFFIFLLLIAYSNLFAKRIIQFENINQKVLVKKGEEFNIIYGINVNPENTKVVLEQSSDNNHYFLMLVPYSKTERDYEKLYRSNLKGDSLIKFYRNEYGIVKDSLIKVTQKVSVKQPKGQVDSIFITRINKSTFENKDLVLRLEEMNNEQLINNYNTNIYTIDKIKEQIVKNRKQISKNQNLIERYKNQLNSLDNSKLNEEEKNRLISILDSLDNQNTKLIQQNDLLNIDRNILEKDKSIYEVQIKTQIKIRNYLIGLSLLALLFLVYYFINYRKKKKINKLLNQQAVIIESERKKSEDLLLNVLPIKIAERLKAGETPISDYFEEVSVVFVDISRFTFHSKDAVPERIVMVLNQIYTIMDRLAEKYHLEKIKTIGDCYMAVAGLPEQDANHPISAANFAIETMRELEGFDTGDGTILSFKIGIDCGPVVAGVIGEKKFIYDLWGDTVNTASRMQEHGIPGKIQITHKFQAQLAKMTENNSHQSDNAYKFEDRDEIQIKGKGKMKTWLLDY